MIQYSLIKKKVFDYAQTDVTLSVVEGCLLRNFIEYIAKNID
jgi:hypothetical protein